MDLFLAEGVPQLRRFLGIKPAEADDDHFGHVVEPFLQVIDQHVFDNFAHD